MLVNSAARIGPVHAPDEEPAVLTVKTAAARACVCESLVRGWIADGRLPHSRVGATGKRGKILVAVEDLDALLLSFKVAGQGRAHTPRSAKPIKLKHLRLS